MNFEQLPDWVPVAACVAYIGLEYAIGKSAKMKSNSVLELVLSGLKALCTKKPPS